MTLKQLKTFLKLAKQYNLKRLKVSDIEFEFAGPHIKVNDGPVVVSDKTEAIPNEDEFLYWSSGFDIEENRKELKLPVENA